MVCYLMFKGLVRSLLKNKITDSEAEEILKDIEKEVGHNHDLIKAVIDFEGAGLAKRLKKKKKEQKKEREIIASAYA